MLVISLASHCLLSHRAPSPVSNVGRKMAVYVPATVYPPRAEYRVCTLQGIQMGTLRLRGAGVCTAVGRLNPSCPCIQSPEWVADLPFHGPRCAFCLGHRSRPHEAPAFHLSLSTQFREAGLRWQLWLRGLMHLSGEQSRCQATARVVGGNHVAPNFPLPGRGLGPGPRWEKLGKGRREGPEPGIWWPGRSWDEGRKTCGPEFGRTRCNCA